MRQRIKMGFVLTTLIGVFSLGVFSSRLEWQPLGYLAQLFHNPLRVATQVASGPVVLERVQRLNRLESCRYNAEVIIR